MIDMSVRKSSSPHQEPVRHSTGTQILDCDPVSPLKKGTPLNLIEENLQRCSDIHSDPTVVPSVQRKEREG